MTTHSPFLIASCPGRTVPAVKAELVRALEAGSDLGEVRLDRFSLEDRQHLEALFPTAIPLVATLRSRAEGGEGPDAPADRTPILEHAARLPFRFLDLEQARDSAVFETAHSRPAGGPSAIISSHLPESASVAEVCRLLELPRPPGAVRKVVLPCSFGKLWSELLPQLSPLGAFEPYVLHTTGPTGPLLRAWAHRLGMFAIYGSLPALTPTGPAETVEPAQLPVDRLRRYEDLGGLGPLFAVVGHPVEHSRSPALHSFWFGRERRNGLYVALDMASAEELAAAIAPLSAGGFRGLNVTHPWKQIALGLASSAGPAAELAGCANTLTFDEGGVSAENTDVAAVRRRLSELRESGVWDGSPVVVLGGGGSARAALAATNTLGSQGVVLARSGEAASELARKYGGTVGVESSLTPARLVIHATPAGRADSPTLDLPWTAAVGPSTHVLDFVYEPDHPFLRQQAEARGATYEDGSRLLAYQAAESYALWWGVAPSPSLQESALREVLCAE